MLFLDVCGKECVVAQYLCMQGLHPFVAVQLEKLFSLFDHVLRMLHHTVADALRILKIAPCLWIDSCCPFFALLRNSVHSKCDHARTGSELQHQHDVVQPYRSLWITWQGRHIALRAAEERRLDMLNRLHCVCGGFPKIISIRISSCSWYRGTAHRDVHATVMVACFLQDICQTVSERCATGH